MRAWIVTIALAYTLGVVTRADAHGIRTAYLEVTELEPGRALVHLRETIPGAKLAVRTESPCTLGAADADTAGPGLAWLLACPGGLAGHALIVDGLGPVIGEAVAYVALADGTTATRLVRVDEPRVELAPSDAGSAFAVARDFVGLGLLHIITGYDHLLFLLLIVLLLREWRSVLLAETAFTLSHSLSFTATALGWIHVSAAAAEACIALSLLLLAADIRLVGPPAPRWRGAALALVFGCVHGLGFAGGLREIGLPDHAIGAALLGFAGGIEIGQVAFLALVLISLHLARRLAVLPRIQLAGLYASGAVSTYWLIERLIVL